MQVLEALAEVILETFKNDLFFVRAKQLGYVRMGAETFIMLRSTASCSRLVGRPPGVLITAEGDSRRRDQRRRARLEEVVDAAFKGWIVCIHCIAGFVSIVHVCSLT